MRRFDCTLFVEEEFNPELGFVRRTGIKDSRVNFSYEPRLNSGQIRKLEFRGNANLILDESNETQEMEFEMNTIGFETVRFRQYRFSQPG